VKSRACESASCTATRIALRLAVLQEALRERPERAGALLAGSGVDVFACTHTCLPVIQEFDRRAGSAHREQRRRPIPNFRDTRFGLATRIAGSPSARRSTARGSERRSSKPCPCAMTTKRGLRSSTAPWPAGSPAALSYRKRIASGPITRWNRRCERALGRALSRAQPEAARTMSRRQLLVAALLIGLIAAFFALDLGQYLRLEYFRSQQSAIEEFRRANPLTASFIFFGIYVVVTSLSLPFAAVMSLAIGAVFGLLWGTLIVSFASSVGATLAFLSSRFLFREAVRNRFGGRLRAIDAGLEKEGAFYLFALRLVPAVPYIVVNLVMGVTPIRTWTFYWVGQIGMLPATIVYVNAGPSWPPSNRSRGFSPRR